MSDWKEDSLHHKYDPLPEEPRHSKKARKRHVRSDHRHEYETVCIDAHTETVTRGGTFPSYSIGTRCRICGRLQDVKLWQYVREPPDGMPLYEVDSILKLMMMKVLPDEMKVRD